MSRMWGELLLCCGVFAALSVYESLRVAYHRQLEGNRRAGTPGTGSYLGFLLGSLLENRGRG